MDPLKERMHMSEGADSRAYASAKASNYCPFETHISGARVDEVCCKIVFEGRYCVKPTCPNVVYGCSRIVRFFDLTLCICINSLSQ